MTSTVTAATLTVTHTESITLNGVDHGATNKLEIGSINEVMKRIVSVPTSEVQVIAMHNTAVSSGTFLEANVRYIRITNLDDTNHVTLTFKNDNDDEFAVMLDRGQTFVYNGDLDGGVVDTMDAAATALSLALGDLVDITAIASTAAVDIEIFVASI